MARVVAARYVTKDKKILESKIHGAFHPVCLNHFPLYVQILFQLSIKLNWRNNVFDIGHR